MIILLRQLDLKRNPESLVLIYNSSYINSIRDIPDSIHRCRFSTYASVVQERLLKSFLHSEVAPAQFERRARLVSLFVKSLQDKSES